MRKSKQAKPRTPPYVPFMQGAANTQPGLSPIAERGWLLPDTEAHVLPEKLALMKQQRSDVYAAVPGSEAAAFEVAGLIERVFMDTSRPLFETPLEDAAARLSDDLCIMQQNDKGEWCLAAASLCAPTFWKLKDKIGAPLGGLHHSVPDGGVLASRIHRIFSGLATDIVLERLNWTVQAGPERFTPDSAPLKALAAETADEDALDVLHLRVERQTIRKLPRTGAVLFTIRIIIDPLRQAIRTKKHRDAFAAAWAGTSPDLAAYKGWPAYDRLVKAALTDAARHPT